MNQIQIAKHLDISDRQLREVLTRLNLSSKENSLEEIRIAYIRDLREKAAGRTQNSSKQKLDEAKTREAIAGAQMKEIAVYREQGLILDRDSVKEAIEQWIVIAKSEYENSIEKILALIEDKYEVELDRDAISGIVESTCRVIGDFRYKSE